jgi:hypothetical protein
VLRRMYVAISIVISIYTFVIPFLWETDASTRPSASDAALAGAGANGVNVLLVRNIVAFRADPPAARSCQWG